MINCQSTEGNIIKTKSDESGKFVTANDDEMNMDPFKGSIALEDSGEQKQKMQKLSLIKIEDTELMGKDQLQGPLTADANDNMGFLDIIPTQHDLDNKQTCRTHNQMPMGSRNNYFEHNSHKMKSAGN